MLYNILFNDPNKEQVTCQECHCHHTQRVAHTRTHPLQCHLSARVLDLALVEEMY